MSTSYEIAFSKQPFTMIQRNRMMGRILLYLLVGVATCFDTLDSGEAKLPSRPGTLCKLQSREVLTNNSTTPAVHRLRFSLPLTAQIPECCSGETGMLHVRVKAPDASDQTMRFNPYSAHLDSSKRSFDLLVKIYPRGTSPDLGVSAYLGAVAVNDYVHVPEIRALDWWRDSKRVGLVCFGVGITECLEPAKLLLQEGAEVRILYANRHSDDPILLDELRVLLVEYPGRFRLRHCISRPGSGSVNESNPSIEGERTTHGRVDIHVLKEEFGGMWQDGDVIQHFFMVGTVEMENSVIGMLAQAQLFDFSKLRGHPMFLLPKGPYGINSKWAALSPQESADEAVEL